MSVPELKELIRDQYEGNPWYGKSTIDLLHAIDFDSLSNLTITKIKSQLMHMINWRYFVIHKINGQDEFDIKMNTEADWNAPQEIDKMSVEDIKRKLQISQIELLQSLDNKSDDWLQKKVPNTKYDYAFLVNGIVQHDIYHIGQSFILSKR